MGCLHPLLQHVLLLSPSTPQQNQTWRDDHRRQCCASQSDRWRQQPNIQKVAHPSISVTPPHLCSSFHWICFPDLKIANSSNSIQMAMVLVIWLAWQTLARPISLSCWTQQILTCFWPWLITAPHRHNHNHNHNHNSSSLLRCYWKQFNPLIVTRKLQVVQEPQWLPHSSHLVSQPRHC